MDVVLVRWSIHQDAVEQFKKDFAEMTPGSRPGLIREDLYRLEDAPVDGSIHFIRVGRWESEDDFYAALASIGVALGKKSPPKPYETSERRREWLAWTRDDIPSDDEPTAE